MYSKAAQTSKKKGTVKSERKRLIKRLDDLVRDIVCKDHVCCCCGKYSEVIQPGHFITRRIYNLRWDLRNVWPQCSSCNLRHNFDQSAYVSFLINKIGGEEIDKMIQEKDSAGKMGVVRMRELEETLQNIASGQGVL